MQKPKKTTTRNNGTEVIRKVKVNRYENGYQSIWLLCQDESNFISEAVPVKKKKDKKDQ